MQVLSIIIPIYNQEKYLRACLGSIKSQTFVDFEVILVDDGSVDSSGQIYEEFASKDSRFVVLRQHNQGVSSARNVGLDNATGEYVLFVDSDDILPSDALEKHVKCFSENVDMTMGSFVAFSDDNPEIYRVDEERNETVSVEKCLSDFTPNGKRDWQRYLWNRMLRMSVIRENHLRFDENIHYKEDGLFLVQYLLRCKGSVAYIPETVYYYRINPQSAMNALVGSYSSRLLSDLDAHILIIKEMKTHHVDKATIDRAMDHALRTRVWILNIMKANDVPYRSFQFCSILRLYWNLGFVKSIQHISAHIRRVINAPVIG